MSGGNKRRRKKCHWNICHLGINVVQSCLHFWRFFIFLKKLYPINALSSIRKINFGGEFLYINKYKIILFFKPRPKKPTHNTNAVHVHTETVKLADFAILLTAQFLRSNITVCFGDNHLRRIYIHTPGPTSLSTELLFLNRF